MYICILDNQLGNIYSVCNALKNLDVKFKISRKRNIIKKSDGIIFPGVGSFPTAIDNLKKFQIYDTIINELKNKKPF